MYVILLPKLVALSLATTLLMILLCILLVVLIQRRIGKALLDMNESQQRIVKNLIAHLDSDDANRS